MTRLTPVDLAAILAYLASIAIVAARVSRRQTTTSEFFVADRRLPGWAVGFSIVGTIISSVSFVGFPGTAFSQDWRLLVPNMSVPFVLVGVTVYVVPFYRRVVRMSSYEYLERRFGVAARLYGSSGFLVLRTIDLAFTLLLTAIAVEVVSGWDIRAIIVGISVVTIAYTLAGGIEAVVWNDVVQGLVLATGALTILFVLMTHIPGGASRIVHEAAAAGKFGVGDTRFGWQSVFGSQPTFWMLLLSGFAHFGRAYSVEQNVVQRYLVARSDGEAQRATFTGALACLVIWSTFFFIGSALWVYYRSGPVRLPAAVIAHPDNILPYFIATELPHGLIGMIVAAILAAAMQAFSADLTSVGTVATEDFFARFRPETTDRQRLMFGRLALLGAGLLAMGVALQLTESRTRAVYELFVVLASIVAGGLLGLFALGFLCERATKRGAYVGLACCVLFVSWATLTGPLKIDLGVNFSWHPLTIGFISHIVLFTCGYAASVSLDVPDRHARALTIRGLRNARPL